MTRIRFAFVAGVTALLALVLSVPAQAAGTAAGTRAASTATAGAVPLAAPAGCPSQDLCVYSGLNYTGSHSFLRDCNRSWVTFGRNDVNASWFNNGTSGRWARIWQNVNFTGNWDAVVNGMGVSDGRTGPVYNQGSSNDWPTNPDNAPPAPSQCPD